jgi:hypothetical protein
MRSSLPGVLIALLLGATVGARARAAARQATPSAAASGAVTAQPQLPLPVPLPPPDRTQAPWSQAPVGLLAIGAVEVGEAAGGGFWRMGTPRGVVLAWRPGGYRAREAGLVIYLHGYYTTVDQAAQEHRLFEQFRDSGRNALFIVPEAPAWNGEESVWPELPRLLDEVARRTGLGLPKGPLVVAAHSGGFRTVLRWLDDPRVEEIELLDGLYRSEDRFRAWVETAVGGVLRRLVLIGDETQSSVALLASTVAGAVVLQEVPPPGVGLTGPARTARLLAIRSQHPHMAIVESGEVVPVLLRATRLSAVR